MTTDLSKIRVSHLQHAAVVYLRQSSLSQVEHNRESTTRQYALADRVCQLGCPGAGRYHRWAPRPTSALGSLASLASGAGSGGHRPRTGSLSSGQE
jgi:hypothetical protein